MYDVVLSSKARQFFEDASASVQRTLDRCFAALRADPRRHSNIKPLSGPLRGYYRFRTGHYRVIYRINDKRRVVSVERIAHRREAYQ